MSCDTLTPNGHLQYLYLPNGVLKRVRRLDSSSKCIAQYLCFASNFVKCFAPASLWEISSRVGVLYYALLMNLFIGFGSKYFLSSPLLSLQQAIAFTQSVGSYILSITPMSSIFFIILFLVLLSGLSIFFWVGRLLLSSPFKCIFRFRGKLPIPWNLSGLWNLKAFEGQGLRVRLCCRKISDSIFWLHCFTPR